MIDAPRIKAIEIFNQGVAVQATDPSMAYRFYASSVDCDPTFAEGWYQMGCVNSDIKLYQAALVCWKRCIELQPDHIKAWVNVGQRLYTIGNLGEARKVLNKALEIDHENGYALGNLALVENIEGNMKKSVALARKAIAREPDDDILKFGLSFALLYAGEYEEGLKLFEARFPYKLKQFLSYPYPHWKGEDMKKRMLFLVAEQGIGDTLSYARFIPMAAEVVGRVLLRVQPELLRLFQAMLMKYDNIDLQPLPCPFPEADYWATTTCLPTCLGLSTERYINTPQLPVPKFTSPGGWKQPNRKIHIGISWAGNPENDIDIWRSMKVEDFFPLAEIPGVQLYSLQVGPRSVDMHHAGAAAFIRDLSPNIRDVADTMGILRELDMVVCAETSVRHMCGALKKECWVPYSYLGGDYRMGHSGKLHPLWDENTFIYRQSAEDQNWTPVFKRISEDLRRKLA